jgi:hypothetical protein
MDGSGPGASNGFPTATLDIIDPHPAGKIGAPAPDRDPQRFGHEPILGFDLDTIGALKAVEPVQPAWAARESGRMVQGRSGVLNFAFDFSAK